MAIVVLPRHTTLHAERDQSHVYTLQIGELNDTTRSLVRGLHGFAVGIRPSLLAAVGIQDFGAADRLSKAGRSSWDAAMAGLHTRAQRARCDVSATQSDVEVLDMLIGWLEIERADDAVRWNNGASLLRHMQLVFDECPKLNVRNVREPLVYQWRENLRDLRQDVIEGTVSLGPVGGELLDGLHNSLASVRETQALLAELTQLIDYVEPTGPAAVPMPLLADDGRLDLLDLFKQARG